METKKGYSDTYVQAEQYISRSNRISVLMSDLKSLYLSREKVGDIKEVTIQAGNTKIKLTPKNDLFKDVINMFSIEIDNNIKLKEEEINKNIYG